MTARIRFGLSLPNRAVLLGLPIETLLRTAELAEEAFDSVWVGDNFLSKPRLEAIVTLSAVAVRTKRVKLGTVCLATFPLRHPLQLAIQWASLDQLSGGRTILSVCLGGSDAKGRKFAEELANFAVPSRERGPRLEEGVELLRRFWGPQPVTYEGRFYRFRDVDAQPKPLQERLPIIIASNPAEDADPRIVEIALRRVARYGDGWQSDGTPVDVFRRRWQHVRAYAEEYGRLAAMQDSSLHLMVNINEDAALAHRESVEFLEHYYGAGGVSDEKLKDWLAYGSPQAVIDKIATFVDAGCLTPILRFTCDDQIGQLERCMAEVLPAFASLRTRKPGVF
ncbi:MAG TPA: LLM class flavin-dependent oxidoreductase [Chloroflexota bacterium]|nr:LLM class flavin-dependent oxidoreductase [Chloroflexota bacterium]